MLATRRYASSALPRSLTALTLSNALNMRGSACCCRSCMKGAPRSGVVCIRLDRLLLLLKLLSTTLIWLDAGVMLATKRYASSAKVVDRPHTVKSLTQARVGQWLTFLYKGGSKRGLVCSARQVCLCLVWVYMASGGSEGMDQIPPEIRHQRR